MSGQGELTILVFYDDDGLVRFRFSIGDVHAEMELEQARLVADDLRTDIARVDQLIAEEREFDEAVAKMKKGTIQ